MIIEYRGMRVHIADEAIYGMDKDFNIKELVKKVIDKFLEENPEQEGKE